LAANLEEDKGHNQLRNQLFVRHKHLQTVRAGALICVRLILQ